MIAATDVPSLGGPVATTGATIVDAPARGAGATNGNPGFQALLERLQQLAAAPQSAPPVATADDLRSAMRDADASFTTAMDLRRQLEEAFRRHQS